MTIKQQGGIFGRNPTFNDVDVEGTLTVNGEPISDFGSMAQQDANNVNIDGGSIDDTEIGSVSRSTVKASSLSVNTSKTDMLQHIYGSTGASLGIKIEAQGWSNDVRLIRSSGSDGTYLTNNYDTSTSAADNAASGTSGFQVGRGFAAVYTGGSGAFNNAMTWEQNGDVTVETGNLVIGTSGKGIDFSATSGTGTSELFDDYEEGTWTPTLPNGGSIGSVSTATYTKTGRTVVFQCYIQTIAPTANTTEFRIGGLPYTAMSAYHGAYVSYTRNGDFTNLSLGIQASGDYMYSHYLDGSSTVRLSNNNFIAKMGSTNHLILTGVYQAA